MIRLTRAQLREIDRLAVERYLIPSILLMENAARCAADIAREMLAGETNPRVLILCGGGNNGGDGFAAARHLHNRGAQIAIAMTTPVETLKGDALINFRIAREMGLKIGAAMTEIISASNAHLIIDAIFGTGLNRSPADPFPQLVDAIASTRRPVLAIDVPSGMDCDTGQPLGACIQAARTITFVAEKIGFAYPEASRFLGKVTVGDIGCPRELIDEIALATDGQNARF